MTPQRDGPERQGGLRLPRLLRERPVVAFVGYWVFAAIATHMPPFWQDRDRPPRPEPLIGLDKLFHFAGYLVFGFLLMNVLARRLPGWAAVVTTMLVLAAWGGIDELTQPAFGRTADWGDWFADVLGAAVGTATFLVLFGRSLRRARWH